MCGITGAVNWGDAGVLERMTRLQIHRGPDDGGTWEHHLPSGAWMGFGNRRLSILDLSSAGHMPMATPDGALVITYNGEVYNFRELRAELKSRGYTFRSGTDTEVILQLYRDAGPDCVRRLRGMFAFAIWDEPRQQLFLARDHFGIKPLYYLHQGDRFAFASEAKALLELPGVAREINTEALDQYLTFLWVPDPLTLFRGIYKLPAGHYAILKNGRLEITRYWDLRFPPAEKRYTTDEAALVEEASERFQAVVKSQMVSDVPLGAFLSAGMDSSSILAAMADAGPDPVRTYTITFPPKMLVGENTLDDPGVARRTAGHFGSRHMEIVVEPDVVELLPRLVWHLDEPIADPAVIAAYLVCREARPTVTVLLSGVGGDELFGGYRKYQAHLWARRYQRLPAALRKGVLEPAAMALPPMRGTPLKGAVRLMKKMARSGSLPAEDRFLMDATYLTRAQIHQLCTPALLEQWNGSDPWRQHRSHFAAVRGAGFLHQMQYLDAKTFLVSLNLTYNDKMSMASSVEVRVPFLDWEFAEWVAWNVPPKLKIRRGVTKYLLRRMMRNHLPPEVLRQKKAGFGAPVDTWLAGGLSEMTSDLLGEASLRRRGLFNAGAVRSLLDQHRSGVADRGMQIWLLLTLELWLRTFMDKA